MKALVFWRSGFRGKPSSMISSTVMRSPKSWRWTSRRKRPKTYIGAKGYRKVRVVQLNASDQPALSNV